MDGTATTQIEMAGTGMTTADTYAFIHYDDMWMCRMGALTRICTNLCWMTTHEP